VEENGLNPIYLPVFLVNGNGGIALIKSTDECFVLCSNNDCFAEHRFVLRAEKVNVCVFVKNLGLVNWD